MLLVRPRRRFAPALFAVAAVLATTVRGQERAEPPNLLFVFGDGHRASAVKSYGNALVRTPNIDRLAAEGARATRAVSNSPVCRPMRFTNLTGRYAFRGDWGHDASIGAEVTIADVLSDAGYDCGYVGKWHLSPVDLAPGDPRRGGFDGFWRVVGERDGSSNHTYGEWNVWSGPGEPKVETGFRPDSMVAYAEEFITREREGPFCLYVSLGPPHSPFAPPERFDLYRDVEPPPNVPRERPWLEHYSGYLGLVEALDHSLGRLLAVLDREGLTENTIVVYTSDHGSMLGAHDKGAKGLPFAESVLVPLVVRWPGRVPAGRVLESVVGVVDLAPTVASLAGARWPGGAERVDGRDVSPLLLGEAPEPESSETMLAVRGLGVRKQNWRGLKTERYTYARTPDGPWLLFDDVADPAQESNLIEARPELVKELDARVLANMQRMGDGWGETLAMPERIPDPTQAALDEALRRLAELDDGARLDEKDVIDLFGLDASVRRFRASRYVTTEEPPPARVLLISARGDDTWSVKQVRTAVLGWIRILRVRDR